MHTSTVASYAVVAVTGADISAVAAAAVVATYAVVSAVTSAVASYAVVVVTAAEISAAVTTTTA